MSSSLKILGCGDVQGKFVQFFKRINSVSSKAGPFDMILCCGDFFGQELEFDEENKTFWNDVKIGKIKVPAPIYLLGPQDDSQKFLFPDIEGCELATDIIYLGKIGLLTTSQGLKMAYISPNVDFESVKSLEVRTKCDSEDFQGVDILLSSDWPLGIGSLDNEVKATDGVSVVSRLAVKLRPRYHFAGTKGVFYERIPYRNHRIMMGTQRHVTRFIAMAKVGNPEKKKWIYAFNIVPMKQMSRSDLIAQPATASDIPYNESHMKCGENKQNHQLRWDMNTPMEDNNRKRKGDRHDQRAKRPPPQPTGPCWFCLSSAEVEKHLVVSVGEHAYLALPKGPLNDNHLLILPIAHHRCALELPEEVAEEIEKFKSSLRKMFKKDGLATIFFERNYKSHHMQLQVIGLPKAFESSIKSTFTDVGSSMQIEMDEVPEHATLTQLAEIGTPYFYVELPDVKEKLYHRVRSGFPIQFGREVICSQDLLDCESKIDWRSCKLSQTEETQCTQECRQRFQPFDFTLEDDD